MADQEDQQPSVADMGDLLDAQKYYQQLAQTPSVQQPQQPQQPSDADVNDLQQAANYYQQLAQTPSATAPQQPATSDVDDLKAAAGYYGMLDQTPLTPEIAAKQKEEEPKDDGDRRIVGTSAKYNTKDEEAAGYRPTGDLSPEEAHGVENARRIQAGLPTIEEEKIHTGRLNALRQAKGLPTIDEEETRRLNVGAKTVEEEDAPKKQHAAGVAHMILAANIPTDPNTGFSSDLLKPNYRAAGGNQDTVDHIPDWVVQHYQAASPPPPDKMAADLATVQNMTPPNNAPPPAPLSGAPGSHTQAGAPPSYLAAQNAPPDLHRAAPTGTGAAPVAGGPLNIPPSRVVGGGWQSTLAPDAQDERRAYQMAQGRNLWANNSDAQDIVRQTQEAAAKRTGELQAQVKHDQFEHQLASLAQEKAQDVYESAQREAANAKVDPDKIYGKDGSGRIFAALGAALGAVGATLGHTQNFALEMVKDQVNASLEAQKAELVGKEKVANNAYSRLLGATGDERAADAAFKSSGLEVAASQALELDSGIKGQELAMSLRNGQADLIRQHYLDTVATERQQPAQLIGGIPKEVRDAAEKIRLDPNFQGTDEDALATAARIRGFNYGGGRGTFEDKAARANTVGRQAHTMIEYQNNVDRINNAISQATDIRNMILEGGKLDPSRTAAGKTTTGLLAPELAYALNGGPPNNAQIEDARKLLPEDPNSYQWTKSDQARIDKVLGLLRTRKEQVAKTGPLVASGHGLEPKATDEENAAAAGATER